MPYLPNRPVIDQCEESDAREPAIQANILESANGTQVADILPESSYQFDLEIRRRMMQNEDRPFSGSQSSASRQLVVDIEKITQADAEVNIIAPDHGATSSQPSNCEAVKGLMPVSERSEHILERPSIKARSVARQNVAVTKEGKRRIQPMLVERCE